MYQVKTKKAVYNLEFCHLQLNITSRCNMNCKHCRGDYGGAEDLSLNEISSIIDFTKGHMQKGASFLISGGEPLLHPRFKEIMKLLKKRGAELVSITSNGSFITDRLLNYLEKLNFRQLRISISLDGLNKEEVNEFRQCPNAFDDAIKAIELIVKHPMIICIVRTTIQKHQINDVPQIVDFVHKKGADIFSISSIIPCGRAKENKELWFDAQSKEKLFSIIREMSLKYPKLIMDVNDPLRCLAKGKHNTRETFGGCIAGIGSFSIEPDGTLLPCPLMHNQKICNIKNKTGNEIIACYKNNKIVHNLLDRNLKGKCKNCSYKYHCGGCRARANAISGDYLGEDPECFLEV